MELLKNNWLDTHASWPESRFGCVWRYSSISWSKYDIFKYWTITVTISNKTFPKWTYSKICVSFVIIFCDNLKMIFWICGLSITVSSDNNDQSVVISHPRWRHGILTCSKMSVFSAKNFKARIFRIIFSLSNFLFRLMMSFGGFFEIRQLLENYFLFENICSLFRSRAKLVKRQILEKKSTVLNLTAVNQIHFVLNHLTLFVGYPLIVFVRMHLFKIFRFLNFLISRIFFYNLVAFLMLFYLFR